MCVFVSWLVYFVFSFCVFDLEHFMIPFIVVPNYILNDELAVEYAFEYEFEYETIAL